MNHPPLSFLSKQKILFRGDFAVLLLLPRLIGSSTILRLTSSIDLHRQTEEFFFVLSKILVNTESKDKRNRNINEKNRFNLCEQINQIAIIRPAWEGGAIENISDRLQFISDRLRAISNRLRAISDRLRAMYNRLRAISNRLRAISDRIGLEIYQSDDFLSLQLLDGFLIYSAWNIWYFYAYCFLFIFMPMLIVLFPAPMCFRLTIETAGGHEAHDNDKIEPFIIDHKI